MNNIRIFTVKIFLDFEFELYLYLIKGLNCHGSLRTSTEIKRELEK